MDPEGVLTTSTATMKSIEEKLIFLFLFTALLYSEQKSLKFLVQAGISVGQPDDKG